MPDKTSDEVCDQTTELLFDIAGSKIKSEKDKEILENLHAHISTLTDALYNPKPRYIDAMFFPN